MTPDGLLLAVMIFVLRVANFAIGTIRLVAITRNMRLLTAVLAFIEALVYAIVIANVVKDLNNLPNLLGYCLGAAVGSYLGMALESRLITSYRIVNIITHDQGHEVAVRLRERGFGVTESIGEGKDGPVVTLRSVVINKELPQMLKLVREINPNAFVAVEEARAVRQGWVRRIGGHPG